jgi:uncharacterized protein (TIGR03083 family)
MAFDTQEQLAMVPHVARQSQRMVRSFAQWPEAFWRRATYCQGWTAADVAAHLATGADFYTAVLTAGRTGKPELPWGARDLDEIRQRRAAAVQQMLDAGPAALLAGFEAAAGRLQHVLDSLQADDLGRMAWHPRGMIPIGHWIGMRLTELVIHDWDIRQPHEEAAGLSLEAIPAVLTSLPEMQQRFLEQRLSGPGMDGVHALQAGERQWAFRIQGEQVTYLSDLPTSHATLLHTDPESMILLTLGRDDFEARLHDATCTLGGDVALGKRLYTMLFGPYLSSSASSM